jgi:hypothetical protein
MEFPKRGTMMDNETKINPADYTHFCTDHGNHVGFIAKKTATEYHMDITVWSIVVADGEGGQYANLEEPYLTAFIKWDGCSTFNFQESLHLCGRWGYNVHCQLIQELMAFAQKEMGTWE